MNNELSDTVLAFVAKEYATENIEEAKELILQIGKSGSGGQAKNRCEIAAIKVSKGTIEGLRRAVRMYHTDWRDLLMAADFGYDTTAHEKWTPGGN